MLQNILTRYNISSELIIGIKKNKIDSYGKDSKNGGFFHSTNQQKDSLDKEVLGSHMWLEVEGKVVSDSQAHINQYYRIQNFDKT